MKALLGNKVIVAVVGILIVVSGFFMVRAVTQSSVDTPSLEAGVAKQEAVRAGLPMRIKIPTIGVDAAVQNTGLKSGRIMETPSNITDVGWYKIGPRPGDVGSAVITGHLVQIRGGLVTQRGVFNDLNKLTKGDKIYVEDAKGASLTFVVKELRRYDPLQDATDVFISTSGAHLNLITCDGVWDASKKSYSKRLVVFADLVD